MKEFEYSSIDLERSFVLNCKKLLFLKTNKCNQTIQFKNSSSDNESVKRNEANSKFDQLLLSEWHTAMDKGMFKFKLDYDIPTRFLDGKYNFILQLNPKRCTEKRPSEIKPSNSLTLEFDKNKFNFTKINKNEILFKFVKTDDIIKNSESYDKNEEDSLNDNFIIINNSPLEIGHILIAPKLNACLNQILTSYAVQIAVEILLLSNSNDLIIGFNSILAYASVNHLHLHAYYLNENSWFKINKTFPFPIQNALSAERLDKHLWFLDEDSYFIQTFALQLCDFNNDIIQFARNVNLVTNYLNKNNIAHNVVFVKSRPFRNLKDTQEETIDESITTIRAAIFPKKSSHDIPINDKNICFAMCEKAGHMILIDNDDFHNLTEDCLIKYIKEALLEPNKLSNIKKDIIELFC